MTVKEALKMTVDLLNGISVPVSLVQSIGEPVAAAIGNLTACIAAIEENEKKEAAKDGNPDAG